MSPMQIAVAAERPGAPRSFKFDIPAQPLAEALQAYSRTTGVQVMFETTSTIGYQSQPVKGEFASDAALRMLLAGTELRVRRTQTMAIVIASASPSAADSDVPSAVLLGAADMTLDTLRVVGSSASDKWDSLGEYIGVVQADLQRALKRVGKATRGEYRVGIKLWVDPSRTVQRAELFGSTGDEVRDTSIVAAIRGLVLSRAAPPNIPQPINFMIAIKTL